ncbi:MAG: hypothetical protein O3A68_09495 [Proteobacteria bacterium]|nr:hypothetical protein [Pseudomonadota bacterium]
MRPAILALFVSTACFSSNDRSFDSVLGDRCKKIEAEIVRLDSLQRNIPSQYADFQERLERAKADRATAADRKEGESMDEVRKNGVEPMGERKTHAGGDASDD